jgi:hypothetical protein
LVFITKAVRECIGVGCPEREGEANPSREAILLGCPGQEGKFAASDQECTVAGCPGKRETGEDLRRPVREEGEAMEAMEAIRECIVV